MYYFMFLFMGKAGMSEQFATVSDTFIYRGTEGPLIRLETTGLLCSCTNNSEYPNHIRAYAEKHFWYTRAFTRRK